MTRGLGTNVLGLTGSATRCKRMFVRNHHGYNDQYVPTAELVNFNLGT